MQANSFLTILLFLLAVSPAAGLAQYIEISSAEKGALSSAVPTPTFLFESKEAKATLVFVPGGAGRGGIKSNWDGNEGYFTQVPFHWMLRTLSDPKVTSGTFNVVFFDSPEDLVISRSWSSARATSEHLSRIEDVVSYYKKRFSKPVWLLGHSMGSISITEFSKRLQDGKKDDLVSGYIYSAGVVGTSFNYETTKVPVLVIHHVKDECASTTLSNASRIYEKLKDAGNSAAEYFEVKTGVAEPASKGVCYSGYHMYFGAGYEVTPVLDKFMAKHLQAK